jgi:hypothetical protein
MLLTSHSVAAEECAEPAEASASLRRVDSQTRFQFLHARMTQQSRSAKLWNATWGAINFALLAGNLVAVPFVDVSSRPDFIVGAAFSTVGVVVSAFPLAVITDIDRLNRTTQVLGDEEPCRRLARAEALFHSDAENEAAGVGAIAHLANAVINVATGLVLWLGYQRLESALISTGVGLVIGEAMILTQPRRLVDDWEDYRSGRLLRGTPQPTGVSVSVGVQPLVTHGQVTGALVTWGGAL